MSKRVVADQLGIGYATLRRALWDGRLREGAPESAPTPAPADKSSRTIEDAAAAAQLGTGCCTRFQPCRKKKLRLSDT